MTDYKPQVGDHVRIVLEGTVRSDWGEEVYVIGDPFRAGSTIAGKADHVVSVEKIEPALQVGWHRVTRTDDSVVESMYWGGSAWFYSEDAGSPSGYDWESVGYLGTGAKA